MSLPDRWRKHPAALRRECLAERVGIGRQRPDDGPAGTGVVRGSPVLACALDQCDMVGVERPESPPQLERRIEAAREGRVIARHERISRGARDAGEPAQRLQDVGIALRVAPP